MLQVNVNGFSNTNTISSHIQALEQINFSKYCKYEGVSVMGENYYEVTESTDAQSNRSFFSGYCNFLNKLTLVINSWWRLFSLKWRNFKDVHSETLCERLSRAINERSASSSMNCRLLTFKLLFYKLRLWTKLIWISIVEVFSKNKKNKIISYWNELINMSSYRLRIVKKDQHLKLT